MMGYDTGCRLYNSPFSKPSHRMGKGKKKKVRRMIKAWRTDGWSRKRAGSLAPQHLPSKRMFVDEGYDEEP